MAKILQIIDVDADGFQVRLDNGETARLAHHGGVHPQVGDEVVERDEPKPHCLDCAEKDNKIRGLEHRIEEQRAELDAIIAASNPAVVGGPAGNAMDTGLSAGQGQESNDAQKA